jgi:prepilin-type N-terminal cleavage/methylation domain-containing protein
MPDSSFRKRLPENGGFTLIELILAIGILTIISSGVVLLFRSAMDSWIYGQNQAAAQDVAAQCLDQLIEGGDRFDGLREVLEITTAGGERLGFVPWWEQAIPSVIPGKKIALEHEPHPASPPPVGQFWSTEQKRFVLSNIDYYPASSAVPGSRTRIAFDESVPRGARARIFYYPAVDQSPNAEMVIERDADTMNLVRRYRGETVPFTHNPENVAITDFRVEYLNSANAVIPPKNLRELGLMNNPVTALRIFITAAKGEESFTLRSFVNIRKKGIAGTGVLLTRGATVGIPASGEVKTLSLINFFGIEEDSSLFCRIDSLSENKSWGLRIYTTLNEGIPWIVGFEVEYPVGKKVFSEEGGYPALRGINLLSLDYSGVHDYGLDPDVAWEIEFSGDDVEFTLERCSIGGVYLLSR